MILAFVAFIFVILAIFFRYLSIRYNTILQKRRMQAIDDASPYKKAQKKPAARTGDDFRSKDKGLEKIRQERDQQYAMVQKYNPNGIDEPSKDNSEIVAIAEPVGRWTRFVTQQKMGWLIAMQGLKGKDTFWQNLIKAQAGSSRGQNQGKGR